jgi:hypothetical protein
MFRPHFTQFNHTVLDAEGKVAISVNKLAYGEEAAVSMAEMLAALLNQHHGVFPPNQPKEAADARAT